MAADADPCLDPTLTDHTRGLNLVYPLEKYEGCTNFNSLINDERYAMQPTNQNEYEVQLASGVLSSLENETLTYNNFVPDPLVKKETKLNVYTRAAPALGCNSDETIQLMLETLEIYDAEKIVESQDLLASVLTLTLIDIIIFGGCFISLSMIIFKYDGSAGSVPMFFQLISLFGAIGLSIAIMVASGSVKTAFEEDKGLIDIIYGNWRCGDSVSSMIGRFMESSVADRSSAGINGAMFLQIFAILAFLLSLVGCVLTFAICKAGRK